MAIPSIVDYLSNATSSAAAGFPADGAEVIKSFYVGSGSVSVGDFVYWVTPAAGGNTFANVRKAVSTTDKAFVGVALEAGTYASGSVIQVQVGGIALANVSGSVSSGGLLATSATAGRAVTISAATSLAGAVALDAGSDSAASTPVYLFNSLGL